MTSTRLLSALLAASLLLVQTGGVFAQTPPPIERTPDMEQRAAELADLFPDSVAGASLLDNLEISVGQELLAELDPSDPEDADEIDELQEFVASTGATMDDAATATSYAQLDEDAYAWVIAFQVLGADVQQALPLFVAAFEEDIPGALVEPGQIGDVDVTLLRSVEDPEGTPFVILARGDVLWLLNMPQEPLEETIRALHQA